MFGILDDIVTDLFCPFKDDLSQHFQGDFQSSLGSCDADPFGDASLFYEDFQPPSSLDLYGYQYVAIPEQSKIIPQRNNVFILGTFERIYK
jgi:hypothetical protein